MECEGGKKWAEDRRRRGIEKEGRIILTGVIRDGCSRDAGWQGPIPDSLTTMQERISDQLIPPELAASHNDSLSMRYGNLVDLEAETLSESKSRKIKPIYPPAFSYSYIQLLRAP